MFTRSAPFYDLIYSWKNYRLLGWKIADFTSARGGASDSLFSVVQPELSSTATTTPLSNQPGSEAVMRVATKIAIALLVLGLAAKLSAQRSMVVINLTEQAAYLLEDGRLAFISPIASGKEGWGTPTGSFRVISKDLNHKSGNYGLVSDSYGRIVNSNATPGSYVH